MRWQALLENFCRLLMPSIFVHCVLFALLVICNHASAGNQKEEALADSVRIALSRAITDARPPRPQFSDINERIKYLHWLGEMSERLKKKLPDVQVRHEFLQTAWYEAKRAGLEPALVLGLIQVESAFRKYALSPVGAHGYMQVMPFWTRVIGDGNRAKLFHMQTNLRYGCSILRMYIDMERGDLYLALGRYNGSRGQAEYPNAILAAWKKWEYKN
jgi:soluble lytic murein transglycosylase-like protein